MSDLKLSIFEVAFLRGLLENRLREFPNDEMTQRLIEKLQEAYPMVNHIIGTTSTQQLVKKK